MSNEQKLTDIIEFYRNKLAEEQLRLADAISTAQGLQRDIEKLNTTVNQLENELEGCRVSEKSV